MKYISLNLKQRVTGTTLKDDSVSTLICFNRRFQDAYNYRDLCSVSSCACQGHKTSFRTTVSFLDNDGKKSVNTKF